MMSPSGGWRGNCATCSDKLRGKHVTGSSFRGGLMSDKHEEEESAEADDSPWSEDKWEAFMKESDLRSARYCELFETLHDDPDSEEKIAKEMGWDLEDDFEDKPWVKEFNDQAAEVMKEIEAEKAAKEE